ncbi:Transcriptional regulator, XRE family [Archangium gephyra]|uniref:Transcriptional regulator, XRE family n=1 Tax=Archangium gephyra TaxID=48 RepID=A0AAC8Q2Y6_9BACT|nr:Transcriptional regulator, XRE family [Archangium gephyra]
MAERLDLTQEVYGRIERGLLLPSVITVRRLSLVLHVSADQLLGIDSSLTHSPSSGRDSPQVRRLIRAVRELSASRLRTLSLLIAHFRRRD